MLGISFSEILLIGIIALLVLGPKQLPQIASRIGLIIFSIRNYVANLKREFYYSSGAHEIINTKEEIAKTYTELKKSILPHNKIKDYPEFNLQIPQENFYQPELDFERQPELFDEPPIHE